jgi:hypothetical protein
MAKGRFTRAEIRALLTDTTDTWARFEGHTTEIPYASSAGARLRLLNGALIIAAIQSAIERGVERDYAIELVGDAAWIIYGCFMDNPDAVVWLTTAPTRNNKGNQVPASSAIWPVNAKIPAPIITPVPIETAPVSDMLFF